ncbi:MAG: hypothetical protein P8X57_00960 [Cyclobacteriaceae bacterium]
MNRLINDAVLAPAVAALLLPVVGMFLVLLVKAVSGKTVPVIQTVSLGVAFLASLWLLNAQGLDPESITRVKFNWFMIGDRSFDAGFLITGTAAIMTLVVTLIAALVSLYSQVYMKNEGGLLRYFAML